MFEELMATAKIHDLDREVRSRHLARAVRELEADSAPGRRPDPALYGRVGWALELTRL